MSDVLCIPDEPPIGTTVRPEPDDGQRWYRSDARWWYLHNYPTERPDLDSYRGPLGLWWSGVMDHLGGAVVVVPTPEGIAGPEECAQRETRPDAATLREQIGWLSADDLANAWHSTEFPSDADVLHHVNKVMAVLVEHGLVEREEP